MMNFFIAALSGLMLAPHHSAVGAISAIDNEYVKCEIVLHEKELKAGSSGYLLISFKPKKGIHVTTDPAFHLSLDTLQQFFSLGKAEFSEDANGYLNSGKTVRQPLTVAKKVMPGSYVVKGTLVYYYCSENDGWCSRFRQPVELTL